MVVKLTEIAEMDHSKFDCLLIAILTHGREGSLLYGTDGKDIAVREITHIFSADKYHSLAGKSKVILLQACQGRMRDEGACIQASGAEEDLMEDCLLYAEPDGVVLRIVGHQKKFLEWQILWWYIQAILVL